MSDAEVRPLLLGEAPSEAGDRFWRFPLSGAPAGTICRLMGWATDGAAYWTLVEHFETMNTIERYRDAYPWRAATARARWKAWREENPGPRVVVALGRKAGDAIGVGQGFLWGEWQEAPGGDRGLVAAVAPHTSGRSRIMNDPAMRDLLRRVLGEAIERAGNLSVAVER